jgi:hypothetical protein
VLALNGESWADAFRFGSDAVIAPTGDPSSATGKIVVWDVDA